MKKVVIVGAGILGTSIAYHLMKYDDIEVTLIDRKETGQATAAAAGIICPWLSQRRNKAWYTLAKNGARYYPTLIDDLLQQGEGNTGYEKVGAICLHHDKDKLLAMKERAEKRREDAPEIGDITMLTEEEAKQRFPLLTEGFHSLFVAGAARVDGHQLTASMQSIALQKGLTYLIGHAELELSGAEVIGVMVNGEFIRADEVIVCAGAWSNEILHPLHIDVNVSYQKAQIIHLKSEKYDKTEQWPVIMPPNDQYLLAFENQKIVIGATHENDVENYNIWPTVAGMNDVLNKGLTIAAGIAECSFSEVKVGFRPFTKNFLPVFGTTANYANVWVANGLGSSGLTVGPYLGMQLAKLLVERTCELDIEHYSLDHARS